MYSLLHTRAHTHTWLSDTQNKHIYDCLLWSIKEGNIWRVCQLEYLSYFNLFFWFDAEELVAFSFISRQIKMGLLLIGRNLSCWCQFAWFYICKISLRMLQGRVGINRFLNVGCRVRQNGTLVTIVWYYKEVDLNADCKLLLIVIQHDYCDWQYLLGMWSPIHAWINNNKHNLVTRRKDPVNCVDIKQRVILIKSIFPIQKLHFTSSLNVCAW